MALLLHPQSIVRVPGPAHKVTFGENDPQTQLQSVSSSITVRLCHAARLAACRTEDASTFSTCC
jgi:hypothetical protein